MATAAQIAELRRHIAEPDNADPWTDVALGAMIDDLGGVRPAASSVWESKAAQVAHLVDISEGGSSRKMSDLYKNFLALAKSFATEEGSSGVPTTAASRSRRGVRA